MPDRPRSHVVYTTGVGRVCPQCGWPARDCVCSQVAATASVPSTIVARLRVEKKGRGGKNVTVIGNLPRNDQFLKDLCRELKQACATGGAISDGQIELQGDLRERVRDCLLRKGFVVKGAV